MTAVSLRGISLGVGGLLVVASAVVAEQAAAGEPKLPADVSPAIRLVKAAFAEMQERDADKARNPR